MFPLRSDRRFIPAYAGNSVSEYREKCGIAVHPRLRGELFPDGLINDPLIGSSPLTRGTLSIPFSNIRPARFIPAYAGNSATVESITASLSIHPRLRGELFVVFDVFPDFVGSSPLTRGTRTRFNLFERAYRFIPAYAGNSATRHPAVWPSPVHPRLRGELSGSIVQFDRRTGSSPLTRGTLAKTPVSLDDTRFIPAYAGNS